MQGKDILETALYDGIDYWANVLHVERDEYGQPVTASVVEADAQAAYAGLRVIHSGQLVPAARKVVELYPDTRGAGYIRQALRDDDPGHIDAEAADMIVQVHLFGEIVY